MINSEDLADEQRVLGTQIWFMSTQCYWSCVGSGHTLFELQNDRAMYWKENGMG